MQFYQFVQFYQKAHANMRLRAPAAWKIRALGSVSLGERTFFRGEAVKKSK